MRKRSIASLSRLSFSTTTFSDTLKRTRRRSRVPTKPLPLTLREKLRFAPYKLRHKKSLVETSNELLDVAQSRLEWLRSQVFSLWNSAYGQQAAKEGATSPSSGSIITKERIELFKTNQSALVMDLRWWFWNILFALSPAILMAAYCEFKGRHDMFEYHQKVELSQMKRIMGEEWCNENAERILLAQKLQAAEPQDRIYAAFQDLCSLSMQRIWELYYLYVNGIAPPEMTQPAGEDSEQVDEDTNVTTQQQTTHDDEPLELTGDAKIDALIRKVQDLETKLKVRREDAIDDEVRGGLEGKMRRVRNSGIGNRVEDELVARWQKLWAETTPASMQTNHPKSEPEFSLWDKLKTSVASVMETKDRAYESPSRGSDETDTTTDQPATRQTNATQPVQKDTKEETTDESTRSSSAKSQQESGQSPSAAATNKESTPRNAWYKKLFSTSSAPPPPSQ